MVLPSSSAVSRVLSKACHPDSSLKMLRWNGRILTQLKIPRLACFLGYKVHEVPQDFLDPRPEPQIADPQP